MSEHKKNNTPSEESEIHDLKELLEAYDIFILNGHIRFGNGNTAFTECYKYNRGLILGSPLNSHIRAVHNALQNIFHNEPVANPSRSSYTWLVSDRVRFSNCSFAYYHFETMPQLLRKLQAINGQRGLRETFETTLATEILREIQLSTSTSLEDWEVLGALMAKTLDTYKTRSPTKNFLYEAIPFHDFVRSLQVTRRDYFEARINLATNTDRKHKKYNLSSNKPCSPAAEFLASSGMLFFSGSYSERSLIEAVVTRRACIGALEKIAKGRAISGDTHKKLMRFPQIANFDEVKKCVWYSGVTSTTKPVASPLILRPGLMNHKQAWRVPDLPSKPRMNKKSNNLRQPMVKPGWRKKL